MIDYDEAVELLNRAVDERGADYVYPVNDRTFAIGGSCIYRRRDNSGPACIAGLVLDYRGLLDEVSECQQTETFDVLPVAHENFTGEAISVIRTAQALQDNQYSWGEAVETAIRETQK